MRRAAVPTALMIQRWETLTFLHWPFDSDVLQCVLPPGLTIDTFDGMAWVALTPFRVAALKPPHTFPLPWLSYFPETNVRTYVRAPDGYPAIWFFSLDAARLLAVAGARLMYGLPYKWASMSVISNGATVEYTSKRYGSIDAGRSSIRIRTGETVLKGSLENFLVERYRLYSTITGKLVHADVEHEPWQLSRASVLQLEEGLLAAAGLVRPKKPPLVHYSPGVEVRIGPPVLERTLP